MFMSWHVVPSVDYFLYELVVGQVWVSLPDSVHQRIPVQHERRLGRLDHMNIRVDGLLCVLRLELGFRSSHQFGADRR